MPFMPIHDDNERRRIDTPFVTWGAIMLCVVAFIWQSSLPEPLEYRRLLAGVSLAWRWRARSADPVHAARLAA